MVNCLNPGVSVFSVIVRVTTNHITTKLTNLNHNQRHKYHHPTTTLHLILKMTTAQVVENVSHQQQFLKTTLAWAITLITTTYVFRWQIHEERKVLLWKRYLVVLYTIIPKSSKTKVQLTKRNIQIVKKSSPVVIKQDWLSPVYSGRLQYICWNLLYTDTPVHWCTIRG